MRVMLTAVLAALAIGTVTASADTDGPPSQMYRIPAMGLTHVGRHVTNLSVRQCLPHHRTQCRTLITRQCVEPVQGNPIATLCAGVGSRTLLVLEAVNHDLISYSHRPLKVFVWRTPGAKRVSDPVVHPDPAPRASASALNCGQEDTSRTWNWTTCGNHRRGVVTLYGNQLVVGPCAFQRLWRAGHLRYAVRVGSHLYRTMDKLRGDWSARQHGCRR